jgi:uncharacterized protein (TIGR02246 family)
MNPQTSNPSDETAVSTLYRQLLDCWNKRDAAGYAALYDEESYVVGFDGSQMYGPADIESTLGQIFADHMTAAYVGKVKGVRFLSPEVAILRAVVGMIPPGQEDLNPAANAIQTLTATKQEGQWRIALFQNTPAQFHGRPELVEALTEELRELL